MTRIPAVLLGTIALMLLAAPVAAQQQQDLDVGAGMVDPGSPLYGLEVAWDNAAMTVGLTTAGTVVQERAAEARKMQRQNNTRGMQRAARQVSSVAERASSDDTEGLQRARTVLQDVIADAPSEAQQGLQTALNNVQQAQQRAGGPGGVPGGPDGNGSVNATALMQEARGYREQARTQIDRGNTALDEGNYTEAEARYRRAEILFEQGRATIIELDSAEARDLQTDLQQASDAATDLQDSVQAYMDGDNQTAQEYADAAQRKFEQARRDIQ